jgi:hypothetical protein
MKCAGRSREQLEVKSGFEVAWASRPWGRTRAGKMPARSWAGRPCHASNRLVDFTLNCTLPQGSIALIWGCIFKSNKSVLLRNTLLEVLRDQRPPVAAAPEIARAVARQLPTGNSEHALVLTGVRREPDCRARAEQAKLGTRASRRRIMSRLRRLGGLSKN